MKKVNLSILFKQMSDWKSTNKRILFGLLLFISTTLLIVGLLIALSDSKIPLHENLEENNLDDNIYEQSVGKITFLYEGVCLLYTVNTEK